MIVTCPSCATRYILDPQSLGGNGRMVRCANCAHQWHQAGPSDMPRPVELTTAPDEVRPIPPGSNLPAFPTQQRRRFNVVGWLAFVLVVLALMGGLVVGREKLVGVWPDMAKLYETIGMPVDVIGAGLELRNVTSTRREDAGASVIVVEGVVVNVSNKPREVPNLRAVVRSEARQDLKDWTFSSGAITLMPGQTIDFKAELQDPPRGAVNLSIDFSAS